MVFQMVAEFKIDNQMEQISTNLAVLGDALASEQAGKLQFDARQNLEDMGAVDTGATWRGVQVQPYGDGSYIVFCTRMDEQRGETPLVPVYINYGTSKMPARPFWDQAVEKNRQQFETAIDVTAMLLGEMRASKPYWEQGNSAGAASGGRGGGQLRDRQGRFLGRG
jgi:hypothetical protein